VNRCPSCGRNFKYVVTICPFCKYKPPVQARSGLVRGVVSWLRTRGKDVSGVDGRVPIAGEAGHQELSSLPQDSGSIHQ
jgi:hypothetical protein